MIRELFDLYATGTHSIRSLREEMTNRGLRNTRGKPLSKHGIEVILANPFYCGLAKVRATGEVFQGCHEPLIRTATFERVQVIKQGKAGKKVTRHNHAYRGLFRCALCSYAMIPERQKGRVYYRCHTVDCRTTAVREDQIEQVVLDELRKVAFTPEQIQVFDEEVSLWPERDGNVERLKAKELQLAQVQSRLDALTDALLDHLVDEHTFRTKKQALILQRQNLQEEVCDLMATNPHWPNLQKFLERAKDLALHYDSANRSEKRQIVEMTTSNRTVSGKEIGLEPQAWLHSLQDLSAVPFGEHQRPNSRTLYNMRDELTEASQTIEAQQLFDLSAANDNERPRDELGRFVA